MTQPEEEAPEVLLKLGSETMLAGQGLPAGTKLRSGWSGFRAAFSPQPGGNQEAPRSRAVEDRCCSSRLQRGRAAAANGHVVKQGRGWGFVHGV